ncbi:unnamed protein product [Sphagnum balticum]
MPPFQTGRGGAKGEGRPRRKGRIRLCDEKLSPVFNATADLIDKIKRVRPELPTADGAAARLYEASPAANAVAESGTANPAEAANGAGLYYFPATEPKSSSNTKPIAGSNPTWGKRGVVCGGGIRG